MRIFMTGATGYIGRAVARELVGAGHHVGGLLRTPSKAALLEDLGVEPVHGDLSIPASYRVPAEEYDALVHLAADYVGDTAAIDAMAIDTLLQAARRGGSVRVFVYTSGCWVLGNTGDEPKGDNASTAHPAAVVAWRPSHEETVLEGHTSARAAGDGPPFAMAVIRPGMVYGGRDGLAANLFRSAERDGASAHIGDGRNRWSMVHREDLAGLYRMVVEAAASGVFHGVDERPVRVREAARAASEAAGAGGATREIPLEEARAKLGAVADALCLDQALVAPRSRKLGWRATRPSFVEAAGEAWNEWKRETES